MLGRLFIYSLFINAFTELPPLFPEEDDEQDRQLDDEQDITQTIPGGAKAKCKYILFGSFLQAHDDIEITLNRYRFPTGLPLFVLISRNVSQMRSNCSFSMQ